MALKKPTIKGIKPEDIVLVTIEDAKEKGISAGWNRVFPNGKYELLSAARVFKKDLGEVVTPVVVQQPVVEPVVEVAAEPTPEETTQPVVEAEVVEQPTKKSKKSA